MICVTAKNYLMKIKNKKVVVEQLTFPKVGDIIDSNL